MPEDNPDIKEYIEAEVDSRLEDGRLASRNPLLAKDIKDALNAGANGM